jgi:tetratricopeptide (TPR) repeat protein
VKFFKGLLRGNVINGHVGQHSNGNVIGQYIIYIGKLSLPLWLLLSIASVVLSTNLGGTLLVMSGISQLLPQAPSGPMDSALNVLVTSFGEQTSSQEGPITPFEDGTKLAEELANKLTQAERETAAVAWGDVEFRAVDEVVVGDAGERQERAAELAQKYRADVVIYGHFSYSRQFLPEFFISPRLGGRGELVTTEPAAKSENTGSSAFGGPIAIPSRRFMDWAERRAVVMASLGSRFDALTRFLFGLALYKGGSYSDAVTMLEASLALPEAWKDLRDRPSDSGKEVVYLWIGTAAVEHARVSPGARLACPAELIDTSAGPVDGERCAEAAYERALVINGIYARARIGKGNIWFQRAERAMSAEGKATACMALERAREGYDVALSEGHSRPDSAYVTAKAHLNLGLSHAHAFRLGCGEVSLARNELTAAIAIFRAQADTQDVPFLRYIGTSALYQLGLLDLQEGRPLDAIERFGEVVVATGPYEPGEDWWRDVRWFALSQQGQADLDTKDLDHAVDAYQQVIDAYEQSLFLNDYIAADTYHGLGAIYNLKAHYEEAVITLKKGIKLLEEQIADPADHDSAIRIMHLELGDAYFNSAEGRPERLALALKEYEDIRNRYKPNLERLSSQEFYNLGMAYCRIGRIRSTLDDMAGAAALATEVAAIPRLRGYEGTCNELRRADS